MPPVGMEPTISAGERPQTYALDRVAAGTGPSGIYPKKINNTNKALVKATHLNTLRTGSFKLFKCPFPGFLTILTL